MYDGIDKYCCKLEISVNGTKKKQIKAIPWEPMPDKKERNSLPATLNWNNVSATISQSFPKIEISTSWLKMILNNNTCCESRLVCDLDVTCLVVGITLILWHISYIWYITQINIWRKHLEYIIISVHGFLSCGGWVGYW